MYNNLHEIVIRSKCAMRTNSQVERFLVTALSISFHSYIILYDQGSLVVGWGMLFYL